MFNNLIESSSHREEFKRRGSFFLFTTVTYSLLLILAAVASIYAYDARLEDQTMEVVTLISPTDFPKPEPAAPERQASSPRDININRSAVDERRVAMLSVNHPEVPPRDISSAPNPFLPVRDGVGFRISSQDINAGLPGGPIGPAQVGSGSSNPAPIVTEVELPPAPVQKPKPSVISKGVITSEALSLPKPPYPEFAVRMKVEGKVSVQILIDETGKVISAKAIDGHPLLRQTAEKAAYQARFSPTILGDQPVKVSGVITYNFELR